MHNNAGVLVLVALAFILTGLVQLNVLRLGEKVAGLVESQNDANNAADDGDCD